jgi:hypothetical protein
MNVDWAEVGRAAHQVELDHGHNGYLYAEKVAAQAEQEFRQGDSEFWAAVAATLRPRGTVS